MTDDFIQICGGSENFTMLVEDLGCIPLLPKLNQVEFKLLVQEMRDGKYSPSCNGSPECALCLLKPLAI